jgi:NitT/TauT family transport system ATP-binding protein
VFPHLSALDNVVFGLDCAGSMFLGRLFGARRKAAVEQAEAMLEQVGLTHSRHAYPSELSGGMQQRLALAQALIRRPRILLLDEPFGALDPGIRLDMHGLITSLWQDHGLTILMVTHDIKEAFKLGTRVLAFDKRRHDPQAPHRFGSTAVYDFPLTEKNRTPPPELAGLNKVEAA